MDFGPEILCMHILKNEVDDYLVVGGNSKRIQVFHLRSGDYFMSMDGHDDSVTCIAADENILFTGGDDMCIYTWNSREWYAEHHQDKKKGEIKITRPDRKEPMRGH